MIQGECALVVGGVYSYRSSGGCIHITEIQEEQTIQLCFCESVKITEEQGPRIHPKNPSTNCVSFKNTLLGVHQKTDNGDQKERNPIKKAINEKSMRKVEVAPSPKQQDLLNRSVVAESVKPIKFGSFVRGFKDLAKEFGRLECRDYGPLKCIISFERVWLEVMGLPIHVWSEDTFDRIAKGMDGILVMQHELTKERASLTVARFLIDCFQWEPIQEWISVTCEDAVFQVYVKEVGADFLSFQVHPERILILVAVVQLVVCLELWELKRYKMKQTNRKLCWQLWKARNELIFQQRHQSPRSCVDEAQRSASLRRRR
ncbi:hypothetical protein PIB30_035994 [Stylosanthes scabra]|uniref:DUF4283 domain-containing protein n=1 Tax=Stylosanthes scabra TaxID=79078 RepID=A0ABU6UC30_9FABA|nr:hypothetical protein [Stylosanthes scabra]